MIQRALRKLHCPARSAMVIGDDERDCLVAECCDMIFYHLNTSAAVQQLANRLF